MIPKEKLFDRFEQSFMFFKSSFKELFLPIFIYFLLLSLLFSVFSFVSIFYLWDQFFIDLKSSISGWTDVFNQLLFNPKIILLFSIFSFIQLLFLIVFIPFKLALIKTISQIYQERKTSVDYNLVWGFKKIVESFKTYWYMFEYAYLLPSILFIAFAFMYLLFWWDSNIAWVFWFWFLIFSIFASIYMVYRGVKILFAIISAAWEDNFTKTNFKNAVKVTNWNWWRIVWNILLVAFILNVLFSIAWTVYNSVIWILFPSPISDKLLSEITQINQENVWILTSYIDSLDFKEMISPSLRWFFEWIFYNITKTLTEVFMTIFMFLFFKRLEVESKNKFD